MNSDNSTNQDNMSQGEDAAPKRNSLLNSSSMRVILLASTIGLGGIFAIAAATFMARVPLSEFAIKKVLSSKGVNADVRIDNIGLNGAGFKTLAIGEKGKETIIANDGRLVWHFNPATRKIIIDEISAQSLSANLGYNKKGIDLRDLKPLFVKSNQEPKPSPVEIENININKLNLKLDGEYGALKAFGYVRGSQRNGFTGGMNAFLPSMLDNSGKGILLGVNSGSLKGDKYIIGAAIMPQGNNIAANKLIENITSSNIRGDLRGNIVVNNDFSDIYFNLTNGLMLADRINTKDVAINNGAINLDKIYLHSLKDPKKDAIISAIGRVNFGSVHLSGNSIGKSELAFDVSRTDAGKTRIAANLGANNLIAANSKKKSATDGIFIKSLYAKSISDLRIEDLTKLNPEKLVSSIEFGGSGFRGGAIDGLTNSLRAQGIAVQNSLSGNGHINITKNADAINILLDKPLHIGDNKNANLLFTSHANGTKFSLIKRQDKWISNIAASGRAQINTNIGNIDAQITKVAIANNQTNIQLGRSVVRHLKYDGFVIDGSITSANYSVINRVTSGSLIGQFNVSNQAYKMPQSLLNINANIRNNIINASANGNIKNFDAGSIKLKNSDANAKVSGKITGGKLGGLSGNINVKAQNSNIANDYNLINLTLETPFTLALNSGGIGFATNNAKLYAQSLDSPQIRSKNISINGPLSANIRNGNIAINSPACLHINMSELVGDSFAASATKGRLCPDKRGRLALIHNGNAALYAQTYIEGGKITSGQGANAAIVNFGAISGGFSVGRKGEIIYRGTINNLGLRINGDTASPSLKAGNANVDVNVDGGKTALKGTLNDFVSKDLPAKIGGSIKTDIVIYKGKLSGNFSFDNLQIADENSAKRFSDFLASGRGNIKDNRVFVQGSVNHSESRNQIVSFYVNHDINSGAGSADINATNLEFIPYNDEKGRPEFGVADLLPVLRGVIVDAKGFVNGDARFEWAKNTDLKSTAVVNTDGLDFGSVAGQFYGVSGNLVFDDLLGIKTAPTQEIKIKEFNPGVPIENGSLVFSLDDDNAINVISAQWPFADGFLRFDPEKIYFDDPQKKITIKADNIDIAQLLRLTKVPDLEVEGRMDGVLPVFIVDNDVEIRDGILKANGNGGVLRYVGPDFSGNQYQKPTITEELKEKVVGKPIPQGADLAIQALRNLHYKVLNAKVSGRLTGDMRFDLILEGNNPELLSGAGFLFSIGVNAPVGGLRKFYQNAFEFDTSTLKQNANGEYEYVPNMDNSSTEESTNKTSE